ncbi:MAG: HAD family hydrolase [Candidatus Limivicinus sp.]|jgi:phosphoglycolate phosphatase
MKFDGIIFDLDGTLWNSGAAVYESWRNTLLNTYGAESWPDLDDVIGIMGLVEKDIADRLFSSYGDRRYEVCHRCIADEPAYLCTRGGEIYEGEEEMLRTLSGKYPLFIVSNCQDGYIESYLSYSGFGKYFKGIECEGHSGLKKAGNIRLICEKNGLKAPIYVGDTVLDEESAAEAGCPFIHAAYGFGGAKAPIAKIKCPGELAKILENI